MAVSKTWASPPIGAASPPSSPAELPIIRGSAGLVGRPHGAARPTDLIQPDEFGEFAQEPAPGLSIPGSCLRVLSIPRAECSGDCLGLMRDGSCLADVIRLNPGAEIEIDSDGYWQLKG